MLISVVLLHDSVEAVVDKGTHREKHEVLLKICKLHSVRQRVWYHWELVRGQYWKITIIRFVKLYSILKSSIFVNVVKIRKRPSGYRGIRKSGLFINRTPSVCLKWKFKNFARYLMRLLALRKFWVQNKLSSRSAQYVPIGIHTFCWNIKLSNSTNMLLIKM